MSETKSWKVGDYKGFGSVGNCPSKHVNKKFANQGRFSYAQCTEVKGHEGKHIAINHRGVIVEIWED